ncbi:nuclear transport factor 2 family protein [Pedobacter hiemivivus]|uniref:Nuclear transport factor 2 family protein n=1 Tax=Pedobacter hiemivivus TaxID=2530454 RepID=A0A4R0M8Y8_9SPHI|nr:nuclear transport factor 2 family protein [Pedobacter hiemivivus]TCC82680.1 nuclear transport factor 2 family protein [Pedobacter hiemivivus]TKC58499.1 nuclear transport factor 2 family protein [Pedobacter hiemivivus]
MNLPEVIKNLVKAQDESDASAYAGCFSQTATVVDEGNTYQGSTAIQDWIDKANKQYQTVMKPLAYAETEKILQAEVSGNFPGSPIVLRYHFSFENNLIKTLKITG